MRLDKLMGRVLLELVFWFAVILVVVRLLVLVGCSDAAALAALGEEKP